MIIPVYIVDLFKDIVTDVITDVLSTIKANETAALGDTSLIQTINFQYGHKLELLETLSQMDRDTMGQDQLKYPLIYLVQDFVEKRGQKPGIYAETSLNILIIHQTDNTYKITDRYANVFKPVLYPIYYSLIDQISHHKQINNFDETLIPHTKIDRSYWGKTSINAAGNSALSLNDYVDAIEISNLDLNINYQLCLTA